MEHYKFTTLLMLIICVFSVQAKVSHPFFRSSTNMVPRLRLGDGYMSYDNMSRGNSALDLPKTTVSYGDKQASIYLDQAVSRDNLSKTLNVDISVNGGWGLFSSSASANYLHHTSNTQYSENFTYEERYYATGLLDISKLSSGTQALSAVAADVYNSNFTEFTNRFGDSYIKQLPFGAVLLVNVQLQFATTLDKQTFNAKLGASLGSLLNATATVKKIVDESHIKGQLEISAYQLGGTPEELPHIFNKDAKGQYYFTQCQLSDLNSCANTIGGVIDYARNNFSQQIKDATKLGEPPQGNLAIVGQPVLGKYAIDFGLEQVPPLPQQTMEARYQLAMLYNKTIHDKNVVSHLLTSPEAQAYVDHSKLTTTNQTLDWNLNIFDTSQAINCYMAGEENNCATTLTTIQSDMRPYDKQYDDMYVFTCSEQTVAPDCTQYNSNICNIYTGSRFVSYPYDASSYFGATSGQFTLSSDSKTLTYVGQWTPPPGKGSLQTLSGKFSSNPDGFWQGHQSQLQGFEAFCSGDVYVRKIENLF